MSELPPEGNSPFGVTTASSKQRTAAYWIGFASGLAPGLVFFAFYLTNSDGGLPESSNGPDLTPYLCMIPVAGIILAIVRRTRIIGLAILLVSVTAGTFLARGYPTNILVLK